jgi:hypothetical protein
VSFKCIDHQPDQPLVRAHKNILRAASTYFAAFKFGSADEPIVVPHTLAVMTAIIRWITTDTIAPVHNSYSPFCCELACSVRTMVGFYGTQLVEHVPCGGRV